MIDDDCLSTPPEVRLLGHAAASWKVGRVVDYVRLESGRPDENGSWVQIPHFPPALNGHYELK